MALEEFVGYMNELREINRAGATLQSEDDIEKKNRAQAYLEERAIFAMAEAMQGTGFDATKITPEQRKQYVNPGIQLRQEVLKENVGKTLHGPNLEAVMNGVDPNKLEELALTEEIAKGKVIGYEELLGKYQGYLAAKQLEARYKAGKANPEELEGLYAGAAEEVAQEVMSKNKGKFSQATLDAMAQVARIVVKTRGIDKKDYLDKGIQRIVTEQEKAFKDYETNSGKKIIDYVKESITALRDNPNAQDSELARELIYAAATR